MRRRTTQEKKCKWAIGDRVDDEARRLYSRVTLRRAIPGVSFVPSVVTLPTIRFYKHCTQNQFPCFLLYLVPINKKNDKQCR